MLQKNNQVLLVKEKFSKRILSQTGVRNAEPNLLSPLILNVKTVYKSKTKKTNVLTANHIASQVNLFAIHVNKLKTCRPALNADKTK